MQFLCSLDSNKFSVSSKRDKNVSMNRIYSKIHYKNAVKKYIKLCVVLPVLVLWQKSKNLMVEKSTNVLFQKHFSAWRVEDFLI